MFILLFWGGAVMSASIHITIQTKNQNTVYPPYYAIYVVDDKRRFVKTLHVMGQNYTYQRNMRDWFRNAIRHSEDIDALSGATLKNGATFKKSVFIDNSYILNKYTLIITSTSRQHGYHRQEIVIPLFPGNKQHTVHGKNHIKFATVRIK